MLEGFHIRTFVYPSKSTRLGTFHDEEAHHRLYQIRPLCSAELASFPIVLCLTNITDQTDKTDDNQIMLLRAVATPVLRHARHVRIPYN